MLWVQLALTYTHGSHGPLSGVSSKKGLYRYVTFPKEPLIISEKTTAERHWSSESSSLPCFHNRTGALVHTETTGNCCAASLLLPTCLLPSTLLCLAVVCSPLYQGPDKGLKLLLQQGIMLTAVRDAFLAYQDLCRNTLLTSNQSGAVLPVGQKWQQHCYTAFHPFLHYWTYFSPGMPHHCVFAFLSPAPNSLSLLLIPKTTAFPFTSDAALETFFFSAGRTGCKQYNKQLASRCDQVTSTTRLQTTYTASICRKHFLPCYFALFPCLSHLQLGLPLQPPGFWKRPYFQGQPRLATCQHPGSTLLEVWLPRLRAHLETALFWCVTLINKVMQFYSPTWGVTSPMESQL